MAAGRPPKPIERKRMAGNPGKRPLPDAAVELPPALTVPPVPDQLGPAAAAMWAGVWTAGRAWLSPQTDGYLIVLLCDGVDQREQLRDELAARGPLLEIDVYSPGVGVIGTRVTANPALAALRALEAQLTRWLSLLGFSPTDRARLGYAQVATEAKLDELEARRRRRPA